MSTETAPLLKGKRADRARQRYLEAAQRYIRAGTPNARIRWEAECRRMAVGLDPAEVQALTAAASRAVERGDHR